MTKTREGLFDAIRPYANGYVKAGQTDTQAIGLVNQLADYLRLPAATPAPAPSGKKTLAGVVGVTAAAALTATIALWEGKENVGYRDIVGVPTACFGDTQNVVVGKRYSDAECHERLERQALAHVEPVLACTPSLKSRPNQLVAAGSLAYNIGVTAYCRSTVDRRFDAGDFKGACDAFLMWDRARGKQIRGLTNRRKYERALCLKGV